MARSSGSDDEETMDAPAAASRRPRPSGGAQVVWRGGVHVNGTVLWCDTRRARELCFLSRPPSGVMGRHGTVICTARTRALVEALVSPLDGEVLVTPYGRPFSVGAARLELFPSGHQPGAASLQVTLGGRRLVYAGAICPRRTLAEPMELREADVLVVDAPVAIHGPRLPDPTQAWADLLGQVRAALTDGVTPLLLVASMALAAEVMAVLGAADLLLAAHKRLATMAAAYRAAGIALPTVRILGRTAPEGVVAVWPLEFRTAPRLEALGPLRRILVGGLALDPEAAARHGADAAVALSVDADRAELMDYVRLSGAREVHLTAGYCDAVAAALRFAGATQVSPLGPPRQMALFS